MLRSILRRRTSWSITAGSSFTISLTTRTAGFASAFGGSFGSFSARRFAGEDADARSEPPRDDARDEAPPGDFAGDGASFASFASFASGASPARALYRRSAASILGVFELARISSGAASDPDAPIARRARASSSALGDGSARETAFAPSFVEGGGPSSVARRREDASVSAAAARSVSVAVAVSVAVSVSVSVSAARRSAASICALS